MWRQGDIFIAPAERIPEGVVKLKRLVLAAGDSTGQRHQVKWRKGIELYGDSGDLMFLLIPDGEATILHPEHDPITLPAGTYRVWKQREFTAFGGRAVHD